MGSEVTVDRLVSMKREGQPIVMLTCYDYPTAVMQDAAGIDVIFIGDSVGTNVLGYDSPVEVTMADMVHHTKAVSRGVEKGLVVGDMPYASYESPDLGEANAQRLMDAGAEMVKLEGGAEVAETVRQIVSAGIPVMGHIGFTPQTAPSGSFVVGSSAEEAAELLQDARTLEQAGLSALVMECVPERIAQIITAEVGMPTIGIGSGRYCDGQVLVTPDLLGMSNKSLRFAKRYAGLANSMAGAFTQYAQDVRDGEFPKHEHGFRVKKDVLKAFREHVADDGSTGTGT
jgi:3-methyl-2-oxobutanoate hydroxymethyltransferase